MPLVMAPRRLTDAHAQRLERIRRALIAALVLYWQREGFDDPPIEQSTALTLAAQRLVVGQTDAYLSLAVAQVYGEQATPYGLDSERLIGANARNGVLLETVFERVAHVGRSDGFERGLSYLRQQSITNAQLAHRRASFAVTSSDTGIVGYRRQVAAFGGKACGMCIAAATRTYFKEDLQPIHTSCRCSVVPLYDTDVIDRKLDMERLNMVYARSGGAKDFQSLRRVRINRADLPGSVDFDELSSLNVRIVDDVELGPMLDADRHDSLFAV